MPSSFHRGLLWSSDGNFSLYLCGGAEDGGALHDAASSRGEAVAAIFEPWDGLWKAEAAVTRAIKARVRIWNLARVAWGLQ
jgi:hypothetical protein